MKPAPCCYQISAVLRTNTRAGSVRGTGHLPQSILLVWRAHPAGGQHFPETCLPSCRAAAPLSAASAPRPVSRLSRAVQAGPGCPRSPGRPPGAAPVGYEGTVRGAREKEKGGGGGARERVSEGDPRAGPSPTSAPGPPVTSRLTPSPLLYPAPGAAGQPAVNGGVAAPSAAPPPATAPHQGGAEPRGGS